jgi:peptidoglycan-associated lipoprotein
MEGDTMIRGRSARWLAVGASFLAFGLMGCQSDGSDMDTDSSKVNEFDQGDLAGDGAGSSTQSLSELQTIYFDFDRYAIRSDSKGALGANAEAINRNAGWGTVMVEGHTDERGSEEYNLALGERRANAVRRYLIDLGVDGSRMRTVSFGEARAAVPGHDENAWRYNRRSEFKGN